MSQNQLESLLGGVFDSNEGDLLLFVSECLWKQQESKEGRDSMPRVR